MTTTSRHETVIRIERGPMRQPGRPFGKVTDGSGGGDVFHVEFDPDSESVVVVVVNSVASIRNKEPVELEPLGDSVDPDMLERVVDRDANRTLRGADVTFRYEGFNVTVDASGDIWLEWD